MHLWLTRLNNDSHTICNLLDGTLSINKNAGVYKIFWIIDSKPVLINRLRGSDKTGILYIGKSIAFSQRLGDIKSSIIYNNLKHHFGIKYYKLDILSSIIRMEDLFISHHEHNNPREKEEKLLIEYIKEFGELPPLNSNF